MPVEKLRSDSSGAVSLACTGQLPPSFVDYVLSRNLTDGVVITGCREGECAFRFGPRWTEARLDGERDPRLRERVPPGKHRLVVSLRDTARTEGFDHRRAASIDLRPGQSLAVDFDAVAGDFKLE